MCQQRISTKHRRYKKEPSGSCRVRMYKWNENSLKGKRKIFKEIGAENFPNLMKVINVKELQVE